ncbi:MAG TPA: hypothetical protein VF069_17900 [Streptosporangiaceae bacterium]
MRVHYLQVDLGFVCSGADDTDDAFDAFTDRVMDALCELGEADSGIVDPDIVARLADRSMSIVMGVEADSFRDALRLFSANVRTALHAAECHTPGWPSFKPATDSLPQAHRADFADA